ncbi:hypothetical protein METBIDRAFT_9248 [Metschnikowia bicuspidata var. bicuspidata NRRL YB-4993]|uniref:Uncharacterized protein n=1 Tax=Metschnikowia bicuspidata var. bicuspidata NRRL YB-4993 TaxID=869754 RepID=A0A1A0HFX2_9ASCO|nr:hypothetical protein METBIDRAFT_9248 [Metschnikowia bicuspidata var. bicuspidata NRRL YB-4993]OBA22901.1 hypothetical protein METBIDRAFT_9248 [Metschnikowia bicuspidata var. bicuspidata NRRL YB-4993]
MKVCSLIETIPDAEDPLPLMSKHTSEPPYRQPESRDTSARNDAICPSAETSCHDTSKGPPTGINNTYTSKYGHRSSHNSQVVPESVSTSLLGPGVKGFAMSPSMFEEALRLRAEQERTEQERLKLEVISKTKSLIQFAIENNVPSESLSIVSMHNQSNRANQSLPTQALGQVSNSNNSAGINDSSGALYLRSPYLTASPLQSSREYENSNNASSVDPMNFRFGGAQSRYQLSSHNINNKRPRSPAKIGAMAVASLANPLTPFRPATRTIPLHQRHYSMPTEITVSDHKSGNHLHAQLKNQNISDSTNRLKSPEGVKSSARVRPIPAQNIQAGKGPNVLQDDMTQHQQVIQFHHWISENPGKRPAEKSEHKRSNSMSLQSLAAIHKRHRSTDISMDLSRVGSMPNVQRDASFCTSSERTK